MSPMLRSKRMDGICALATAVAVALSLLLWGMTEGGDRAGQTQGYETLLFDTSRVHTMEITLPDWEAFIANATAEEYCECDVTVDGERYAHVAIRAKGNTSLSTVAQLGSQRYSFKIEFDHYNDGLTYHGLDKLSLNNLIQDATMMKDYLAYTLMARMEVPASLGSYVQLTVNGEPWGLYLAVEGVEEAFLARNGMTGGELYKPDSMSIGNMGEMPGGEDFQPETFEAAQPGGFGPGQNNDDVKLIYTDDNPDSYPNIFNNAKTDVTGADKQRLVDALRRLNVGEALAETVDQDEVIRYLAVHHFLCNDDSYTGMMVHNYYLYEEQGRLSIIPWDYNLAFGGFSASEDATSVVNAPMDSPVSGGTTESRPLIAWIFTDEASLDAYHAAYADFIGTCLSDGALTREIDRVAEIIRPYVQADPTAFYTAEEFETAVDTLKRFCEKRTESLQGQLDGTIPATSQGQREAPETLVDASELSTRDMGSMDTSNGPGGKDFAFGMGEFPENFQPEMGEAPPALPEENAGISGGSSMEFSASGTGQAPETNDASSGSSGNAAEDEVDENPPTAQETPADAPAVSLYQHTPSGGNASAMILALGCVLGLALALLWIRRVDAHNQ